MKVFCIIVTYNGSEWIDKCLQALCTSTVALHIIAVDNASSDNTVALIKEKFPLVHVIEAGANLGFGRANNIGLKIALQEKAEYVILINQDAWPTSTNTLSALIEKMKSYPQYGILSSLHLKNQKELEFYFSTIINPYDCPGLISDFIVSQTLNDIYPIKFVHAAFWLISADCLNTVGFFDPLFPHYAEDNDYAQRANYFGYKLGICPHLTIIHDIGERKISDESQLYFQKLRILLQLKDLNKSLAEEVKSFLWLKLKLIFTLLFKLELKKIMKNIRLIEFVVKNYSTIKKSRCTCLNGGRF